MNRLIRAGLATGVTDACFASILTLIYGRSVVGLWEGVASVPFGAAMIGGGTKAVLIGLAMHFFVAFAWATVLLILLTYSAWLRGMLASPNGFVKVAVVYGPMIWIVMSCVMIPLFTSKPTTITWRWWVQLAGHFPFVGLPMCWVYARSLKQPR